MCVLFIRPSATALAYSALRTGEKDICRPSLDILVMQRRAFLSTILAGTTVGTAGCMGGEVVLSRKETVTVPVGRGDITELPESGEKIRYIARDDQPFDVYVFTSNSAKEVYRASLDGEEPSNPPPGQQSLSSRALRVGSDRFEVTTDGRTDLDGDGNAYFVLDHSDYRRETPPRDDADPLSVSLDLEVVESSLPI
jgi:hypothetical protein